jgi:hypothetical protein
MEQLQVFHVQRERGCSALIGWSVMVRSRTTAGSAWGVTFVTTATVGVGVGI